MLTDEDLSKLLQIDLSLVTRLVEETAIPRLTIAGELRFLSADVLAWLSDQAVLLPVAPKAETIPFDVPEVTEGEAKRAVVTPAEAETVILPAQEDEVPFASRNSLLSLGQHAADPSYNLARQQVRDGLAALGDSLHPTLVRRSSDRLHPAPAEADRTTPWRLDDTMECIDHITMTWAEGEGPPGFRDRPRVALVVTSDAIEFSVQVPNTQRYGAPNASFIKQARAGGAMISISPSPGPWSVTYLYDVARGAPTNAALVNQLGRDSRTLVPLWLGAVDGGPKA